MFVTKCPICGSELFPKWQVYDCSRNDDYNPRFPKLRQWLECEDCQWLFANEYPDNLEEALKTTVDAQYLQPKPQLSFVVYSDILSSLKLERRYCKALDVGCGGGELVLTAREFGYDVDAIDIRQVYVDNLKKFGVNAICSSFEKFQSSFEKFQTFWNVTEDRGYDLIFLGDIIEHIPNPKDAILMGGNLLQSNGRLWISTPNYKGAFTAMRGDDDAMRSVCEHLSYPSKEGLFKLLKANGFRVEDFRLSKHFCGCMEVTARRIS